MSRKFQHAIFYSVAMLVSFLALMLIFKMGPEGVTTASAAMPEVSWFEAIRLEFMRNINVPITGLILQILVILVFSWVCGHVLQLVGQPKVIGEMLAGILLGKSILDYFWPEGFSFLFPDSSMPRLYFLSQIGLILFMFVVGLNLKISELKNRASAAVFISHMSIVVPFLLGSVLSLALYSKYGPQNYDFISFALFMGIAMSITAFPVLARILQEKNLTDTPLGVMALTCAAVDDVTAWCALAAVIGIVKAGSVAVAIGSLVGSILFVIFMIKLVKPFVAKRLQPVMLSGELNRGQLSFLFCVVFGSAVVTEIIGIHALFGAFLAGTIMPQSVSFRASLIDKIEDVTAVILLPIFFAYTGIRTQVGLLNDFDSWAICLGIIIVAIAGKMGGSGLAARWSGMSWSDAWALGALMNTRGLMELVVLNIGYDIGILSPALFTMMVVMALFTTMMTSPLLSLLKVKSTLSNGGLSGRT